MSAILTDEQFAWIAARDAELARLRTRCSELNEACAAKQALLDHVAADERDFMELVEGYKRERDAALRRVAEVEEALLRLCRACDPAYDGWGAEEIEVLNEARACLASGTKENT